MMMRFMLSLVLVGCAASSSSTNEEPESAASVRLPEQEIVADEMKTETTSPTATTETYQLPAWTLKDVQPKSASFGQTYGLDKFAGKTIVVVLLEGLCPYCQSNSIVAQRLQDSFDKEKLDVQIVVLGDLNGDRFANKVSLPTFKDDDGKAWDAMRPNASKHDTFVFGPDGKRTFFWLGSYQGDATRWTTEVGEAARAVAKPR